jgi:hypothetical protein
LSKDAALPVAPKDHPYYLTLRQAAEVQGLLEPFRKLCMLLGAPPDLDRHVFLQNLAGMLKLIPESWETGNCFDGWGELIDWWLNFKPSEELPVEWSRSQDPRGGVQEIEWANLTPFPIFWAAECETQDARYLLLLAHLILTRYRDLQESPRAEGASYEDLYEVWADSRDFARMHKVRSPWRAAAAISAVPRRLSQERQQQFYRCIDPTLRPGRFGFGIPASLPAALQDLEPLFARLKRYCQPEAIAPKDHPVYQAVCSALEEDGYKEPFQRMCMILNAPPDLKPLPVVLKTIEQMIAVLPAHWKADGLFGEWSSVARWFDKNLQKLESDAKAKLDIDPKTRTVDGVTHNIHPRDREGISRYHLFSMMCDVNLEMPDQYRQLQAQLLVARWRELSEAKSIEDCVLDYESYAGHEDFAPFVRSPYPASLAVRRLSEAKWSRVIEYLRPERIPDEFPKLIEYGKIPLARDGENLSDEVWHIRNYCGLQTTAREDVQAGVRRRSFRRPSTFIPYNETRFGIEAASRDGDDLELNENVGWEWIYDRLDDEQTSASVEVHPNEDTDSTSFLLFGNGGREVEPGSRAIARTRVHHVEIDKERMPWSASHLRSAEIQGTLVAALQSASLAETPQTGAARSELEVAALVAVCLDTGRSIDDAMELCFAKAEDTLHAALCFVPGDGPQQPSEWCIRTIEPKYKTARDFDENIELPRADYVRYPTHPIPDRLLSLLEQVTPREGSRRAFNESVTVYKKWIRDWLRRCGGSKDLPNSKRLTIAKVSSMKWNLLEQRCGCDFATASIALGVHHRLGEVALHYSLVSVERATELFGAASDLLWNGTGAVSNRTDGELR